MDSSNADADDADDRSAHSQSPRDQEVRFVLLLFFVSLVQPSSPHRRTFEKKRAMHFCNNSSFPSVSVFKISIFTHSKKNQGARSFTKRSVVLS